MNGRRVVAFLLLGLLTACTSRPNIRVEDGPRSATVRAVDSRGQDIWQRQTGYPLPRVQPEQPNWGLSGNAVWVTAQHGEISWAVDNLGFRLSDGQPLWALSDMGAPLFASDHELLLQTRNSIDAYPDLREYELAVVDTKTGAVRHLKLHLPERQGCGDPNRYSLGDLAGRFGEANDRYFWVVREDKCGVFTARFDWHGESGQRPFIVSGR